MNLTVNEEKSVEVLTSVLETIARESDFPVKDFPKENIFFRVKFDRRFGYREGYQIRYYSKNRTEYFTELFTTEAEGLECINKLMEYKWCNCNERYVKNLVKELGTLTFSTTRTITPVEQQPIISRPSVSIRQFLNTIVVFILRGIEFSLRYQQ